MEASSGEELLSQSFVHLVSNQEGGNSFWARLLNGADKVPDHTIETMAVSVTTRGSFALHYNPEFVRGVSARLLKLALIHEAGHIGLRHHERFYRLLAQAGSDRQLKAALSAVFNIAADLAVNDSVVRHDEGFARSQELCEWDWLLPETMDPPLNGGESFEKYMAALLPKGKRLLASLERLVEQLEAQAEEGGSVNTTASSGVADQKRVVADTFGGGTGLDVEFAEGLVEEMRALAEQPELAERMEKAFRRLTKGAHARWLEEAQDLTPEQALETAEKLKRQARALAQRAWQQTMTMGDLPGDLERWLASPEDDHQVPWESLFVDAFQGEVVSKIAESMAAPNVALINDAQLEPWPGLSVDHEVHVGFLRDSSGSISDDAYLQSVALFNAMLAADERIRSTVWDCDAVIQFEAQQDSYEPSSPGRTHIRYGHGGTDYRPVFKRILGLDGPGDWAFRAKRCEEPPRRLDLLVVYTDGYVIIEGLCFPKFHPGCPVIWLIAPGCRPAPGMSAAAPDHVIFTINRSEA